MVKVHKIPPELVINWDQAGVKLIPSQSWTMEEQGLIRVEIAGINDKHQIIYTTRSYITLQFKELWSSLTFSKGTCYSVQTLLEENRIFRVTVPNNCTDLFQPLTRVPTSPSKIRIFRMLHSGGSKAAAKNQRRFISTHLCVGSKIAEL